jgi:hypothetical protein
MLDKVKDTGKTAAEESDWDLGRHEHLRISKVPCSFDQFAIPTLVHSLTRQIFLHLIT